MTLAELVARFREDADDEVEPYLFARAWVVDRLNDALTEACLRARLVHESDRQDVCRLSVEAARAGYLLHPMLIELDHVAWQAVGATQRLPLDLVSTEWLDDNVVKWRDLTGTPRFAIQTDRHLRLVPSPALAGELLLEGYRLPLEPLALDDDEPEVHTAHHRHLVQWVLWCAFSKPDVDYYDLDRARAAEAEFTRTFGPRPDADLRRVTREDTPHRVVPAWA